MVHIKGATEKSIYPFEPSEKTMYPVDMAWLNYHHLLYFWTVARDAQAKGCISRCKEPNIMSAVN